MQRIDKQGCVFEVGECGPESVSDLRYMYDNFGRLAVSQGLPPAIRTNRENWIDKLVEFGRNFLAWKEGKAIGHCSIIPDFDRGDAEFIIFVNERFRNRGIGTALTALALETGESLGLTRIWLTVESFNFRAIRLYRNAGFVFADEGGEQERTMTLRLGQ
jgi:RimJ/RimL family protein N-acetyltransferase